MKRFFLLLFILAGCSSKHEVLIKNQYFIFGTIIDVLVWTDDKGKAQQALFEVEDMLNNMHKQWHAWKPGRLYEINKKLRDGETIKLDPEEASFIKESQRLSELSLGYFNPAIGELIDIWGFHTDNYPITSAPPAKEKIERYLQKLPEMSDLIVTDNFVSSKNPAIWLDFGGIAKGYAIDKAIQILQKHGLKNAIVNAGGDLRSIGKKGKLDWKVAVRKPNSSDVIATIEIHGDESVFTSGNYERYKQFAGKRYAHIINPRTGYGLSDIISATVITDNGIKADAAATALIIAEKNDRIKIIDNLGLSQVLLIEENGDCLATVGFIERVSLDCKIIE